MLTFRVVVAGLEDLSERYPGLDGALHSANISLEAGMKAEVRVMQRGKVLKTLLAPEIRRALEERRSQLVF